MTVPLNIRDQTMPTEHLNTLYIEKNVFAVYHGNNLMHLEII